jgi:DNA repair exonuclease SbcCD ATPase subunit
MVSVLRAIFAFHRCHRAELPVEVASLDQLRQSIVCRQETLFGTSASKAPKRWMISKQLWSSINMGMPCVADRMAHLKTVFRDVERETKEALAELERNFAELLARLDSRVVSQRLKLAELERQNAEQDARELELEEQEAGLRRANETAERTKRERQRLVIKFAEEVQSWRQILQNKHSEELERKQCLTAVNARNLGMLQEARDEIEAIISESEKLEGVITGYASEHYKKLVSERDDLLQKVRSLSERVEQMTHVIPERGAILKRQYREQQELLQRSDAIRKTIEKAKCEAQEEEETQRELQNDIDHFSREVVALEDNAMLLDVHFEQLRRELRTAESRTADLQGEIDSLLLSLKQIHSSSPQRFLLEKERAQVAEQRRLELESAACRMDRAQRAVTTDLQQNILNEKLKLRSSSHSSSASPKR